MPSAMPINRKCWCCDWPIGDILVPHCVPPKGNVITAPMFLDIEKSVLLELKGVKVIISYRDFFQLIRDFFQLMIHFVFFI